MFKIEIQKKQKAEQQCVPNKRLAPTYLKNTFFEYVITLHESETKCKPIAEIHLCVHRVIGDLIFQISGT